MTGESVEDRMEGVLARAGYPADGIEKEALFMVRESEKGPLAEATAWQNLSTSDPGHTKRIRGILGYLRGNPGVRQWILTGEGGGSPTRSPGHLGPVGVVGERDPIPVEDLPLHGEREARLEAARAAIPFTTEDLSPQEMQAFIERLNGPIQFVYGRAGSMRFQSVPSYLKDRAGFVPIFERQATVAQMESNPQQSRRGFDRIIHRLFFIRTYDPRFDQWNETLDFRWIMVLPILFTTTAIAVYIIWEAFA